MEPNDTGIRYRVPSVSDYMEGFNYELDAADRVGYSCGCFLAAIKMVGLAFRFISSSLGAIGSAITSHFSSRRGFDSKCALEYLYNNRLSDKKPFLYPMPSDIEVGFKGIGNMNNSCTIASLLFNMLGATSFF
ncbi:MAG: hypothetical protein K1060chlam4_00692, partial [Candidatus Anoxychlamydiales bacterium]|nr:hypothetical protein [Candidatus Anoxychlamydiales bacterium]